MKKWLNTKKNETSKVTREKLAAKELSDDLMSQIIGGAAAALTDCHTGSA